MKKLVLSAAILAMGICTASAALASSAETVSIAIVQQKTPPPAGKAAKKQAEAMKTSLKLTADQTTKLEAAILARITKQREIQKTKAGDKAAIKTAMKPVGQAFQANLKTILTPAQLAQHNAAEAARVKAKKKKA